MSVGLIVGVTSLVIVAAGIVGLVVLPYMRIQAQRAASYRHLPQKNEVWFQDGVPFRIHDTNVTGVEIMAVDPETRQVHHWKDSWSEWNDRLKARTVIFSGTSRPLITKEN